MATAEQIRCLVSSHVRRDDRMFRAVVMQIIARQKSSKMAEDLRALLGKASAEIPEQAKGLLSVSRPSSVLYDLIAPREIKDALRSFIDELKARDRLRDHGLQPATKMLLTGPPGTGKTMTAAILAGELGLPLMRVELHAVICSHLGETASKLRHVFDTTRSVRGVYLLDEIDALGASRHNTEDVGEMRRAVNSLLQFLEEDHGSVIVGTTNLASLLDHALHRRFDKILEYQLPDRDSIEKLMRDRLASYPTVNSSHVEVSAAAAASVGMSHAEVVRVVDTAVKRAVLRGDKVRLGVQ